jgi:hypothetical protein
MAKHPSLVALREKLKVARENLLMSDLNNSWHDRNMREMWQDSKEVLAHIDEGIAHGIHPRSRDIPTYDAMRKFKRAADVYYHAKQHGLQSAMLMRLSSE